MTKGDCDLCGRWDGALAEGVCGECRERYCGESNTGTFRHVLADMQPEETLAGYAARVKRDRDEWRQQAQAESLYAESYRAEKDALAAHVERLRSDIHGLVESEYWSHPDSGDGLMEESLRENTCYYETPTQSLAAVRAEAVESAAEALRFTEDGIINDQDLIDYAQQLRNGSDDDE